MSEVFSKTERVLRMLRDIGIVLGVPTLIAVGSQYYEMQLSALRDQNELLKETQFDRARDLLKAQKELYESENRIQKERVIKELQKLQSRINEYNKRFNDMPKELFKNIEKHEIKISLESFEGAVLQLDKTSQEISQSAGQIEVQESE